MTENKETTETHDFIKALLPLLNLKARVQNTSSWLDLAYIGLNSRPDDKKAGLKWWTELTEQGGRDPVECLLHYNQLLENALPVTVKTLGFYARQDSPKEYTNWHKQWYQAALKTAAESLSHAAIAQAVYRCGWLDFVVTSMKHNQIRHFNGIHLMLLEDDTKLLELVSKVLLPAVRQMTTIAAESGDETLTKQLVQLTKKLGNRAFVAAVLKEVREEFYVDAAHLDANPNLMGLANGVLECTEGKVRVRPGKPEDYISKSSEVAYDAKLSEESPQVKQLLDWLHQVFPGDDMFHYACKLFAATLCNTDSGKGPYLWVGGPDSGMSALENLYKATLGPYAVTAPAGGKYNLSAFEQAQLRSAKVVLVPEEKVRGASFDEELISKTTLVLQCAVFPDLTDADEAALKRLKFLLFKTRWLREGYPEDVKEQVRFRVYKSDPAFVAAVDGLAAAFLWLLMRYYPLAVAEGLARPKALQEQIAEQRKAVSPYDLFIKEHLLLGQDASVGVPELYDAFKQWYRLTYDGQLVPTVGTFRDEVSKPKRLGKLELSRRWHGVALKPDELPLPA
ncbi:D5 DNA Primase [uncultured virus]|nr:D5 DNA Primase [uncultured virus]